jgi:hypothetical protein
MSETAFAELGKAFAAIEPETETDIETVASSALSLEDPYSIRHLQNAFSTGNEGDTADAAKEKSDAHFEETICENIEENREVEGVVLFKIEEYPLPENAPETPPEFILELDPDEPDEPDELTYEFDDNDLDDDDLAIIAAERAAIQDEANGLPLEPDEVLAKPDKCPNPLKVTASTTQPTTQPPTTTATITSSPPLDICPFGQNAAPKAEPHGFGGAAFNWSFPTASGASSYAPKDG